MISLSDLGLKTNAQRMAFFLTFLMRILGSFVMFLNPAIGWLTSQPLDYLDAVILDQIYKIGRVPYTKVDKVMDLGVDLIMLLVSIKFGVFVPLLLLLVYRTVGQIIYWKTGKQWLFILFPNFFESYWLWSVALVSLHIIKIPDFLLGIWGLIILMALKMAHELYNHFIYPKYVYKWSMKVVWHKK